MIRKPHALDISKPMKYHLLIDTAYLDNAAGKLAQVFQDNLGRPIPPADLAKWLDCLMLDCGLRPGEHEITAYFISAGAPRTLNHVVPSNPIEEIHNHAFKDNLGEFTLQCVTTEEMVTIEDMITDAIQTIQQNDKEGKVIVVTDKTEPSPGFTLCGMYAEPHPNSVNIGYALMAAMNISPNEL